MEVIKGQLRTLRSNASNPHHHYCSILLPGFTNPITVVILDRVRLNSGQKSALILHTGQNRQVHLRICSNAAPLRSSSTNFCLKGYN